MNRNIHNYIRDEEYNYQTNIRKYIKRRSQCYQYSRKINNILVSIGDLINITPGYIIGEIIGFNSQWNIVKVKNILYKYLYNNIDLSKSNFNIILPKKLRTDIQTFNKYTLTSVKFNRNLLTFLSTKKLTFSDSESDNNSDSEYVHNSNHILDNTSESICINSNDNNHHKYKCLQTDIDYSNLEEGLYRPHNIAITEQKYPDSLDLLINSIETIDILDNNLFNKQDQHKSNLHFKDQHRILYNNFINEPIINEPIINEPIINNTNSILAIKSKCVPLSQPTIKSTKIPLISPYPYRWITPPKPLPSYPILKPSPIPITQILEPDILYINNNIYINNFVTNILDTAVKSTKNKILTLLIKDGYIILDNIDSKYIIS